MRGKTQKQLHCRGGVSAPQEHESVASVCLRSPCPPLDRLRALSHHSSHRDSAGGGMLCAHHGIHRVLCAKLLLNGERQPHAWIAAACVARVSSSVLDSVPVISPPVTPSVSEYDTPL